MGVLLIVNKLNIRTKKSKIYFHIRHLGKLREKFLMHKKFHGNLGQIMKYVKTEKINTGLLLENSLNGICNDWGINLVYKGRNNSSTGNLF